MYPTFAPEPLGTPTQHHVAWADEILLPLTFIADRPVTFIADRPLKFIADRPVTFIGVQLTIGP